MDDLTRETGAADEMSEQEILEQEIGELPVGYISKKNIHGKTRYYRQWTENGKIKSQYIREEELEYSFAQGMCFLSAKCRCLEDIAQLQVISVQ